MLFKILPMNKIVFALAIVMATSAYKNPLKLNDIIVALNTGNANNVSKYFDNTVEISIAGKSSNYSKNQAETILNDFFDNNTVKSFAVIHRGESGEAEYCIGTLITQKGSYRTTLNLKQKGDKKVLQEVKFEK